MTTTRFSDRSRQQEYQRCQRARYWAYEAFGTGVRKVRASIPLATGTYVHVGLGNILRQVLAMGDVPHAHLKVDVEAAVGEAVEGYRLELKARGLDVELGEDGQYVADEQVALTEALIRAYVKAGNGLEQLLGQYKVLEVEREDVWPRFATLDTGHVRLPDGHITFQARADGLLQERSSGDLYVLSFKTAAGQDWRRDDEGRHDVQGLSEAATIERRLAEDIAAFRLVGGGKELAETPYEALIAYYAESGEVARIMGIQMVYLVKGRREEYPEDSGRYVTQSSLIRGWSRPGITDMDYAWRYKWFGPDIWEDSGKLKGHTLGKGWTRFDVWKQPGGVAAWIELLASRTVQPEAGDDPFNGVVWQPMPYFRQDRDVQDWLEQAQAQERRVAEKSAAVEAVRAADGTPDGIRHELNALFPQNRRACDWPSKCQFLEICFGDDSMLVNPFATGFYQRRLPHHAPEMAAGGTTMAAGGAK